VATLLSNLLSQISTLEFAENQDFTQTRRERFESLPQQFAAGVLEESLLGVRRGSVGFESRSSNSTVGCCGRFCCIQV
jgi:hypothetical protein